MRVRLLLTGRAEMNGLPDALRRLFPDHDFEPVPLRAGTMDPWDGFTSSRLPIPQGRAPSILDKLVGQLAAEVCPGRQGKPADLAVLLDDLELCNADQAEVVVRCVREALLRHIQSLPALQAARVANALRERASFHLANPMLEAWFFGDDDALRAAGVPADRRSRLRAGTDLECFEVDDSEYASDTGAACVELHRRNTGLKKPLSPRWVLPRDAAQPWLLRERHPKAYLCWLCRDPGHEKCTRYRESQHGADALRALRWELLLSAPTHCVQYARAFLGDLETLLGPAAVPLSRGLEAPLLSVGANRRERVLRNV